MSKLSLSFDPQDAAFNRANALYLAHASDVAYHRAPADLAWERLGLKAVAFRHRVTRTRGYLGVCETHAVLAFRGTDPVTLPSWVTDFVAKLVECGEYDGRVHFGFSSALRRTWRSIETVLDEAQDKPLFVTGHSMGGALSVLSACKLARMGRPPVAAYTFGAPRVGDEQFCQCYSVPTYRVVNRLDIVPEIPPRTVAPLVPDKLRAAKATAMRRLGRATASAICYGHVNTLVYIDRDGKVILDADVEPWRAHAVARAIHTRGKSFLEGITDHLISNYIRGLEREAVDKHGRLRRRTRDG